MVILIAVTSLGASYTFLSIQQERAFEETIKSVKSNHRLATNQMFIQNIDKQMVSAEEIIRLNAEQSKNETNFSAYLESVWPNIQLSFSLSSMAFTRGEEQITFGNYPDMPNAVDVEESLQSKRGIVCHEVCEISSTIPIVINDDVWMVTLFSDVAPSILFLKDAVMSEIGVLSPKFSYAEENRTLSRYVFDILTGKEKNIELFDIELNDLQLNSLESDGLRLSTVTKDYYLWFESVESFGENFKILFIRDISTLVNQQESQSQQVIIIFVTLTFGVLLFLILFSIIPISKINQLKRAIKLIGKKEYHIARYRLGKPTNSVFRDELHELEDEFRNAINVLETYEQQLSSSQRRLVRQATIDAVTGLYTRNVLVEDLEKMNSDNNIQNVAIYFLDLDGFKPVNDNLGHEAGDIMLKKIGYRLKGVVNKHTKVYRIGGDEFVICLCNHGARESLDEMADSVVDLFAAPFHIYDNSISISASIGIATQAADSIDSDQLLRYADIAMYQAKEDGKNCYRFFDDSMRDSAQRRFAIKNDFITSLNGNQLFVVFQPIVSSTSLKVTKLESLCRWQHPELGFIPPPIFIDVIEESENMNVLFEWIVKNVIQEILYLDTIGRTDIIISINLSPSQLVNDAALTILNEKLSEFDVSASRIELEITETSLITSFDQAKHWIEEAKSFGFKIAIDDFGAGYSSLSYLTSFPYDTVKLDRSLLNNIDVDIRQQRIVSSLTQMLHSLSVPIVAEGAETDAQFLQLKTIGCDYIQGYLISKPVRHEQLVTFLNQQEYKNGISNVT